MASMVYQQQQRFPDIACCLCGTMIQPNGVNTCNACLGEKYKITAPLDYGGDMELLMCKRCGRFRTKHSGKGSKETWAECELETPQLMALCLRTAETRIAKAGLELKEAEWIWTEPHSRRLKVRCIVKKFLSELPNGGVTLQAAKTLQYKIETRQCTDCASENSSGGGEPWRAVVQLRQHVDHKRTLLALEQKSLDRKMLESCLGIQQLKDGLDLYFTTESEAAKFVDFVKGEVPVKVKNSSKLISQDHKSNKAHMKKTALVEVVPLCKDDLLILPKKSPVKLPGIVLVVKVSSTIHLVQVQPPTMRRVEMTAEQFWRAPFTPFMSSPRLIKFTLLDIDVKSHHHGGGDWRNYPPAGADGGAEVDADGNPVARVVEDGRG
eukprot:CAMPEP_0182545700 /NCGR_PEP_ID=MMETSP1323-20130603/34907_1 /TAXON_ID=236787 /ORGANISM="Florenciella parvula, Strain RCC1693" /LENGTH=379 /DNA_ID=CAMNT_0024756865 /DNA_START=68 /DNA_END=1204 /DNA_ORIENTATION=+